MTRAAFIGGTLVDGNGGPPLADAYVVVEGSDIVDIGSGAPHLAEHTTAYDVAGMTIMPGLIDAHVHLLANAAAEVRDVHLWNVIVAREEQTLHAAGNARKALLAGVTTVRDMAGSQPEVAVKHAIDDHVLEGARVLVSGFVGMTAGHGDMFCPATVERRLWKTADGTDECRKLVREYARMGVDWIKLCTSGGILSVGDKSEWRNYTIDEAATIVDEAHALGKRVAAHAHSRAGIEVALRVGVDTLEHGSELDDELIDLMLEAGTQLCPTLSLAEYIDSRGEERGVPAASLEKSRKLRPVRIANVRRAYERGVPLIMGTDSCNTMAFGSHAGELTLMARHLGMPPMECIVASTSRNADALGIGDRTGRIAPGLAADLLVVDGNPLDDLTVLEQPERLLGIMREGRLVESGTRLRPWSADA